MYRQLQCFVKILDAETPRTHHAPGRYLIMAIHFLMPSGRQHWRHHITLRKLIPKQRRNAAVGPPVERVSGLQDERHFGNLADAPARQ